MPSFPGFVRFGTNIYKQINKQHRTVSKSSFLLYRMAQHNLTHLRDIGRGILGSTQGRHRCLCLSTTVVVGRRCIRGILGRGSWAAHRAGVVACACQRPSLAVGASEGYWAGDIGQHTGQASLLAPINDRRWLSVHQGDISEG
jgi:hypothetical protein